MSKEDVSPDKRYQDQRRDVCGALNKKKKKVVRDAECEKQAESGRDGSTAQEYHQELFRKKTTVK